MKKYLYLFSLLTVFIAPSATYAAVIGTGVSHDFNAYVQQVFPSGELYMQLIAPQTEDITFENFQVYACYDLATTTKEVRANLYWLDNGEFDDDPVLTAYSDWVELETGAGCTAPTTTFSFGWKNTLDVGRYYGITFTQKDTYLPSTALKVGFTFATTTYTYQDYPSVDIYTADTSMTPWGIDEYNTDYYTETGAILFINGSDLPVNDTSYITITDVFGTNYSGTTTVHRMYDCSHSSTDPEQYGNCYATTTHEVLTFSSDYVAPSSYSEYYVESWLLNENGYLIDDNEYYHRVNTLASVSGELTDPFVLPVYNVSSTIYMYRVCIMPSANTIDTDISCATMVFGNGYDSESAWFADYAEWTRTSDGITFNSPATYDASICTKEQWLTVPVHCAWQYASTTMIYFFPFGTGYQLWTDFVDSYENSTSTATSTFNVSLNMAAFGLPTTTANLPVSAMAYQAKVQSPDLFDAIDKILWGLFALFVVFRIFSGTWTHGLGEDNSRQIVFNRY